MRNFRIKEVLCPLGRDEVRPEKEVYVFNRRLPDAIRPGNGFLLLAVNAQMECYMQIVLKSRTHVIKLRIDICRYILVLLVHQRTQVLTEDSKPLGGQRKGKIRLVSTALNPGFKEINRKLGRNNILIEMESSYLGTVIQQQFLGMESDTSLSAFTEKKTISSPNLIAAVENLVIRCLESGNVIGRCIVDKSKSLLANLIEPFVEECNKVIKIWP